MIVEQLCITAHSLLFKEIAKNKSGQCRRVIGKEQSSFLNFLALDVKYLYSNTPGGQMLDNLLSEGQGLGLWRFKQVLKVLKPDAKKGHSLKLVTAQPEPLTCPVAACLAKFAEQKGVKTNIWKSHPNTTANGSASCWVR
jgi:hypothetical protein